MFTTKQKVNIYNYIWTNFATNLTVDTFVISYLIDLQMQWLIITGTIKIKHFKYTI